MSRRRAITEDDRADFTRRWEAGETGAVIAAAFGCSTAAVYTTAARFGLPARQKRAPRPGRPTRPDPYALVGGSWVPDRNGIGRWVPGATG